MSEINSEDYKGYRGVALNTLQKFNSPVWSDVEIIADDGNYKGLILPRSETADEFHIVLKLPIGYNIGIAAEKIKEVNIFGRREAKYKIPEKDFPFDPKKPKVKLLGRRNNSFEIGLQNRCSNSGFFSRRTLRLRS